MNTLARVALVALGTGVAGYVLENVLFAPERPRHSHYFPNLPFMPVYAAGGAAIALLEPHVRSFPLYEQALIYGGTLTALEGGAGLVERSEGRASWDYEGAPIDLGHAAAWTVLGTTVGQALSAFAKGGA